MGRLLVDLRLTMESGQPPHFLWNCENNAYWRQYGDERIVIRQTSRELAVGGGHRRHADELLRASDDLQKIYDAINTDETISRATSKLRGMRLTKNGEWETLVSYLCSQNSNIKRIRANVQMLSANGAVLAPAEIAGMDLRKISLGYRENYLRQTARLIAEGEFDLLGLRKMGYEEGREELQALPGVGPKVADCVLLYGFGKLEAFPCDVWVARAMREWYGMKTQKQVADFAYRRWGELAGYAQQYLFMLGRSELAGAGNKKI